MNFLDNYGFIEIDDLGINDNCVLFSVENLYLKSLLNQLTSIDVSNFQQSLKSIKNGNDYFQSPNNKTCVSHDNLTAIFCFAHKFHVKSLFQNFNIFKSYYINPVNFVPYCKIKGSWYLVLYYLLLPLFFISMIFNSIFKFNFASYPSNVEILFDIDRTVSVQQIYNEEKKNVGHVTIYENRISKEQYAVTYLVGTSDILLSFLVFNTLNLPLTQKVCEYFYKRRLGTKFYKTAFDIYFIKKEHPNRMLAAMLWGN
jgi:hypothetical protein